MVDTLEFIEDLKSLQNFCDCPFTHTRIKDMIKKYEGRVEEFEKSMEAQHELFFGGTPFYNPVNEV